MKPNGHGKKPEGLFVGEGDLDFFGAKERFEKKKAKMVTFPESLATENK